MIQIFPNYPWHPSDQPSVLKKEDKKLLRKDSASDFIKLLLTNLVFYPYLFIKFLFKNKKSTNTKVDTSFYGLCVNLDKGEEQVALVEELGVKSLQIRFYLSDMENLDAYVAFAKSFGEDKDIVINIIQDRKHIEQEKLLHKDIRIVFDRFSSVTNRFIIGNAINRIKWGFVSIEEYLEFYEKVQNVRDEYYPHIQLIGSSVIDFEYHFTIRTLFNHSNIHYDGLASLLYVDRRGAPSNTQYGLFDLKNKIEFLDTIVKTSNRCENKIIISETNWPLKDTAPYAPTSELECVSHEEYTKYMIEYFDIASKTNKIETIYWHQLIAPGYGLVDNRDGKLVKLPQFEAFKKMIQG